MKGRTKILIGVTAVAVLAAGGAAYVPSQDSTIETTTCDYAEHYTTVSTLAAHSDLVVAGQIGKRLDTTSGDGGAAAGTGARRGRRKQSDS